MKHTPTYCKKCGAVRDPYSNTCLSDSCLAEYWDKEAERYEREARQLRERAAGLRKQQHIPVILGLCSRCKQPLDNVSPGFSIIQGGAFVCALCLRPGEEILRARGM